jgi:hypothetical protein
MLDEYVNEFKKEVQNIYGTSYDDLNRPANTDAILEDILTAIKENNATLESVLQPPKTATDMANSSPSRSATDVVSDDEDDNKFDVINSNPGFDKYNVGKINELMAELGTIIGALEQKIVDSGIDMDDDKMNDYIIPRIIDLYNAKKIHPPLYNVTPRQFEAIIRRGDIEILEHIVEVVKELAQQPLPTLDDFENVLSSDEEQENDPDEPQKLPIRHDIVNLMDQLHTKFTVEGKMEDEEFEKFIVPKIIELYNHTHKHDPMPAYTSVAA